MLDTGGGLADGSKATVAMLFSDIEGSTGLVRALGDRMADLLDGYHAAVAAEVQAHGGEVVNTEGDGLFAVFPGPAGAVAAAVAAQRRLAASDWPEDARVRARMGVHVGEVLLASGQHVGLEVHRAARIAAAGHGGQVLVTQPVHDELAAAPPDGARFRHLGDHRFKDLLTPEPVYQVVADGLDADFPPIRSVAARAHNLPGELTELVGRDETVAEVAAAVRANRLVTIAAIGGAGKTRLAVRVGNEVLGDFDHGVWFVELAPVSEPADVAGQLARALRLHENASSSLEDDLVDHLADRNCLVILDNCEHLVAAAAAFARRLLTACPDLAVLATSRETLNVAGEVVHRLAPLPVPPPGAGAPAAYPAVALFAQRAAATDPSFRLDTANVGPVAEICRRLDGIPLAIELAAARMRMLPVQRVADELGDQLRLLATGDRTAPSRHQTLRGVLDYSHDLLGPAEQVLFRRASVFAGGFTLDAVEDVAAGPGLAAVEVLDLLGRLVDSSLVVRTGGRFRMLEPVRQYAALALAEAGETAEFRRRHAEWCSARVHGGGAGLPPQEQAEWLVELEEDDANFRQALAWADEAGEADLLLRLAGGLSRSWYRRGVYTDAGRWFDRVLAHDHPEPSYDLARILRFAAAIANDQGNRERADEMFRQAAEMAERLDEPVARARIVNLRADMAWTVGDLDEARRLCREALDIVRPSGHPFATRLLANLALIAAEMGRLGEAREAATELAGWAGHRDVPDVDRVLGGIALAGGDLDEAVTRLTAAVAAFRRLGMSALLAMALKELATALVLRGDAEPAGLALREAVELFDAMGDRLEIAAARSVAGLAALDSGDVAGARDSFVAAARVAAEDGGLVELAQALTGLSLVDAGGPVAGAAAWYRQRTGWSPPPQLADRLPAASPQEMSPAEAVRLVAEV